MRDLNQCQFIGNMTRDPEVKYMPNGNCVTNFSIACNDDYKDKNSGEMVKVTNYINLVAFGKPAELIGQYCLRGSKLFVSGKQRTRKWQHSDGSDRYATEVVISEFQFLDKKKDAPQAQNVPRGTSQSQPRPTPKPKAPIDDSFDDDIPF